MTARRASDTLRPVLRPFAFLILLFVTSAPAWALRADAAGSSVPSESAPNSRASSTPQPQSPDALIELPISEASGLEELNLGWMLARTLIVLTMVIALAWLTLNVGLRRLLGIRRMGGTSMVTVLERVPLDQKRSLFVVEAGGEVLLLGGGEGNLSLIAKLDRAELEKVRAPSQPGSVQLSPFLKKLLGRKDTPQPPATS